MKKGQQLQDGSSDFLQNNRVVRESLNCKNVQHVKIYKKVPQLKMSDYCVKSYSS
jgi:hypothetical protein